MLAVLALDRGAVLDIAQELRLAEERGLVAVGGGDLNAERALVADLALLR
jgi:hypothetical protein